MNSSGQSVSANPLFKTTDASALAATAKASSSAASNSSKAMNNKEFSNILDKQQAAEKVAEPKRSTHAASDSMSVDKSLKGNVDGGVVEEVVDGFQVLIMAEGGKSLPAEGFALPLMAAASASNSTSATLNVAGEALTASNLVQSLQSNSAGQSVIADVMTDLPEGNIQGFAQANISGQVMLPVTPGSVNQAAVAAGAESLAAPLAGINLAGQGQRNGSGLNFGASAAQPAAAVLSTEFEMDVANKPVTGLASNASATVTTSSELMSQLQSPLAQTITPAFATEATSTGTTTELNSLLTTEAPQAYRASAQASLQTAVPVEVGKPGWSEAVMARVMWMSSQQINKAEIALDPPELGPLQVRITTNGDQTTVSFTSQHGSVRDALDQGLPRLREMMDGQGLNLADVDVSDQHQQQSQRNNAEAEELANTAAGGEGEVGLAEEDNVSTSQIEMRPLSLIDQYV